MNILYWLLIISVVLKEKDCVPIKSTISSNGQKSKTTISDKTRENLGRVILNETATTSTLIGSSASDATTLTLIKNESSKKTTSDKTTWSTSSDETNSSKTSYETTCSATSDETTSK